MEVQVGIPAPYLTTEYDQTTRTTREHGIVLPVIIIIVLVFLLVSLLLLLPVNLLLRDVSRLLQMS